MSILDLHFRKERPEAPTNDTSELKAPVTESLDQGVSVGPEIVGGQQQEQLHANADPGVSHTAEGLIHTEKNLQRLSGSSWGQGI